MKTFKQAMKTHRKPPKWDGVPKCCKVSSQPKKRNYWRDVAMGIPLREDVVYK